VHNTFLYGVLEEEVFKRKLYSYEYVKKSHYMCKLDSGLDFTNSSFMKAHHILESWTPWSSLSLTRNKGWRGDRDAGSVSLKLATDDLCTGGVFNLY
jgi:hypothetical protein